jgi:hypothetical protein
VLVRRPPLPRGGARRSFGTASPCASRLERLAERVGEHQQRRERRLAASLLEEADVRAVLGLARTMFARGGYSTRSG